ACLLPVRRRLSPSLAPQAQGRVGEGCFLPGAPTSTPSQPPPCPLRGQRGGAKRLVSLPVRRRLSPSLAPQAQGRVGEGCFLPGAPKSTPSHPPPCPPRGQGGRDKRSAQGVVQQGGEAARRFAHTLFSHRPPSLQILLVHAVASRI